VATDKPREFDYASREDEKFWQTVRARPGASVRDVRSKMRDIDRRIADIETHVTTTNSALAKEIDALR
jgi:phage shock protein C